jgi:hypothetical protein
MDVILSKFIDKDYEIRIKYNKDIKELNEYLNIILYLCNNVNYERIKMLFINLIENDNYYDNTTELSDFKLTNNIKVQDIDKYIENNNDDIYDQLKKFNNKYDDFIETYKNKNNDIITETDFKNQNQNIKNKLSNIISILTIIDNQEHSDINFNIILIDKNSYIFTSYQLFKSYLFKNLHCVEEFSEDEKKGDFNVINQKLKIIYDKLSYDVLEKILILNKKLITQIEKINKKIET